MINRLLVCACFAAGRAAANEASCTIEKASFRSGLASLASKHAKLGAGYTKGSSITATGGGSCYNDAFDCSYYAANYYVAGNKYRADFEMLKDCMDMVQWCTSGKSKQTDPCYTCQRLVLYHNEALLRTDPVTDIGDDVCTADSRADCYAYFAAAACYAAVSSCSVSRVEDKALTEALTHACTAWDEYQTCDSRSPYGSMMTVESASADACNFVVKAVGVPREACGAMTDLLGMCDSLAKPAPLQHDKKLLKARSTTLGKDMSTCVEASDRLPSDLLTSLTSQKQNRATAEMLPPQEFAQLQHDTQSGVNSHNAQATPPLKPVLVTVASVGVALMSMMALFVSKKRRNSADTNKSCENNVCSSRDMRTGLIAREEIFGPLSAPASGTSQRFEI